jgi:hypothetical protein
MTPNFAIKSENLAPARRALAERAIVHALPAIVRHLDAATQAWEADGRRMVRVWDLLEFSVALDGTDLRVAYLMDDAGLGRAILHADLSRPIGSFGWHIVFDPVLAEACRAVGMPVAALTGATGIFMHRVLGLTFRRYVDWNRLRRSVLHALALDPLVSSLVRRTFTHACAAIDDFNWVERHQRELSLVAIESSGLLPFLQFGERGEGSLVEIFDRLMVEAGMTPSARRKLERWGDEAFATAMDSCLFEDWHAVMARYANLLDRLQVECDPGVMFTELAMATDGFAPDWYLRALWNEVQSFEANYPDDDPYPVDFPETTRWIASNPPEPDENQKRAGWMWIATQSKKHCAIEDAKAAQPWPVPCGEISIGRYSVSPIASLAQLREEALAMRNCLETLEEDCRSGRVVVFRIAEGDRRVASFTLCRVARPTAFWQLSRIAGKANSPVAPVVTEVAMAVAGTLGRM